jgi:hypothetical protein
MKYADIPKFTRTPSYRVNVSWNCLENQLNQWSDRAEGMGGIDLDPAFQRAHVWTEEQQRRYVEFILRGGQSGREILWNAEGWGRTYKGTCVLVDGKQRLEAVRKFLRNELAILGLKRIEDFSDKLSWDVQFIFSVNDLKTEAEVLNWYLELNTGGTPHTDSEIQRVQAMLKKLTIG